MKKILLLVLVAFSFMFMTTNVNAEETLKELDSSALDVIDSTYHINKKESEVYSDFEAHYKLADSIKQEYIQKIKEAGYDTTNINLDVVVMVELDSQNLVIDIPRHIDISLYLQSNTVNKRVDLTYANTSNYNQTDADYVKNQIKNLKTKKYKFSDGSEVDAVYSVFDINDKVSSQSFIKNYNYSSLLDDKAITIKVICGESGFAGNPWGESVVLIFFKNDIAYATKVIYSLGYFGQTLDNGTPIAMTKQDENTEIYKEMAKELEKLGLNNVIGCYELEAYGDIYNNMIISFNIGTQYNGRGVKILHRKNDGTFETFETKVENGKATITVSEFSPFMIALTDDIPTATKLSNNAQTSSMNIVFYVIMAIGSLIGITYILIKKKKIA